MSKRHPARRPFGPIKTDFKTDVGSEYLWEGSPDKRGASATVIVFASVIFFSLFSDEIPDNQGDIDHCYGQHDCHQIPVQDVIHKVAIAEKKIGDKKAG